MKKLVSHFFIPLYENYFSKLNIKKPVNETKKIADAIFHEREFIEWLRINRYLVEELDIERGQKLRRSQCRMHKVGLAVHEVVRMR